MRISGVGCSVETIRNSWGPHYIFWDTNSTGVSLSSVELIWMTPTFVNEIFRKCPLFTYQGVGFYCQIPRLGSSSMSSPTKIRRLPAWAGSSIPSRAQAARTGAKDISQESQSGRSQPQSEDVTENVCSRKAADVPTSQEIGLKQPVQDFSKLMEGVIFTISGIANPERTELRNLAIDMGAQYRPTWSVDSTLLVCPFPNTPTFKQVQAGGGTIVHKDWVTKCHNHKGLVAIEPYLLNVGKPWKTGCTVDGFHDFGVANDFAGSCGTVQQKSADNCNRESEKYISRKELSKQPGSPGEAGMDYHASKAGGLKNVASPVDIQQWVLEDLAATLTWLEQQNDKPEEHELEAVAAQGLLVCLEDAVRSLEENQGLSMVMDNWAFVPRAIRELAVYGKGGEALRDQVIAEGERFKVIYESQLKKLGFGFSASRNDESRATRTGKDESNFVAKSLKPVFVDEAEKDVDDDATEIISDADSRDPADFDTDDTEELDADEIAFCKEKILDTFRLY